MMTCVVHIISEIQQVWWVVRRDWCVCHHVSLRLIICFSKYIYSVPTEIIRKNEKLADGYIMCGWFTRMMFVTDGMPGHTRRASSARNQRHHMSPLPLGAPAAITEATRRMQQAHRCCAHDGAAPPVIHKTYGGRHRCLDHSIHHRRTLASLLL